MSHENSSTFATLALNWRQCECERNWTKQTIIMRVYFRERNERARKRCDKWIRRENGQSVSMKNESAHLFAVEAGKGGKDERNANNFWKNFTKRTRSLNCVKYFWKVLKWRLARTTSTCVSIYESTLVSVKNCRNVYKRWSNTLRWLVELHCDVYVCDDADHWRWSLRKPSLIKCEKWLLRQIHAVGLGRRIYGSNGVELSRRILKSLLIIRPFSRCAKWKTAKPDCGDYYNGKILHNAIRSEIVFIFSNDARNCIGRTCARKEKSHQIQNHFAFFVFLQVWKSSTRNENCWNENSFFPSRNGL